MDSLGLRVVSIFVLCAVSLIGIVLPLGASKELVESDTFCVLNSLAAGTMLGLCLVHLMPEASELLEEAVPDFPLGYALVGLGVTLVLFVEQITLAYTARGKAHALRSLVTSNLGAKVALDGEGTLRDANEDLGNTVQHEDCCDFPQNYQDVMYGHDHSHMHQSHGSAAHEESEQDIEKGSGRRALIAVPDPCSQTHTHCHDHGAMALDDVMNAKDMRSILTAYTLEVSTAIHSIIIGVGLGALTDTKEISVLLAALCFHQLIEGIGLGSVLASSRQVLSSAKIVSFVAIFALVVPIGVVIGIASSSQEEGETQKIVQGVLTSLAAGAMLYSAMVEVMACAFNRSDIEDRVGLKSAMLFSFLVGYALMVVIGLWA